MVLLGWALPQALPDSLPGARVLRSGMFWGVPFFLEPILIRLTGRTIGQACLGLRVVSAHDGRTLGFARLVLRYWCKLALGTLSLFYILFAHRRQALHDRIFDTAVLDVPRGAEVPGHAGIDLAAPRDPGLPRARRRFAAFIVWAAIAQLGLGILFAVVEIALVGEDAAGRPSEAVDALAGFSSLAAVLALAHLGASGRLLGARRIRISDAA